AYGAAEAVIGELSKETASFDIVTKTSPIDPIAGARAVDPVINAFRMSLERLRRSSVYGLLVHNADVLLGPHGAAVWASLEQFKASGHAKKIGVSVYDPAQLEAI